MPKKKPEKKTANEMTDKELIESVFPPHVVERIRREHSLDEHPIEPPKPPLKRPMKAD